MLDSSDVRRIALSLPGTVEKELWNHPTFHVAGRMFVTVPGDGTSFAVRYPRYERDELIAAEPERFWVPPHEANSSWVRARLAALDGLDELYVILVDSWRQAAPAGLAEADLPARPPRGSAGRAEQAEAAQPAQPAQPAEAAE
ncbi:MmcQ/YjbR family DNA-binding protein [Streptomyces sp. NBC_01476]|uniref:MmcQ/YjbR family DNA-binding protein n=1 Tax=Streptomyces sp. NBC_01476 TaxID=2903881 RepID=UPI002E35BCDD|nr:MmcQ/YjbR family DNA-binding protein [Streptomyces sp. NBC_01476]